MLSTASAFVPDAALIAARAAAAICSASCGGMSSVTLTRASWSVTATFLQRQHIHAPETYAMAASSKRPLPLVMVTRYSVRNMLSAVFNTQQAHAMTANVARHQHYLTGTHLG
jgi:hypothetical protein